MTGGRRPAPRRWTALERELRDRFGPLIAGVDEVGRGPLAGPVVACAVVLPPDARAIRGVDDSKKLTASQRVRLAGRIRDRALAVGLGAASVREIDRVNIFHATVLAMRRALSRLRVTPHHVVLDGREIRSLNVPHTAVVGGDGCCPSIACASIIAKVTRDRLMTALARRHPGYLWERNAGYGTAEHIAALHARGLTAHHRRTFNIREHAGAPEPRIVDDAETIGELIADALERPGELRSGPTADAPQAPEELGRAWDRAAEFAGDPRADGSDEAQPFR